jgi:hypothetical protein
MNIKRLVNVGGLTSLQRYVNMMTGNPAIALSSTALAIGTQVSPYVYATAFNPSSGFGAKYTDPAALSFYVNAVTFNSSKTVLATAGYSSYAVAFPFNSATGFGTKYSDPATNLPSTGTGVSFSASGDAILFSHNLSPYMSGYPFNSGFGTKYSNPATLPPGYGLTVKLTNSYAFVTTDTASPYIAAYAFNSTTGFGTKYSDPATVGSYNGYSLDYNSNANAVVYGGIGYVYAYPFSAGFGTKYSQPAVDPGYGYGIAWNPAGTAIGVTGATSSPYINAYTWSSGWGTKYSNPTSLPVGSATGSQALSFGSYGDSIAMITATSPYIQAYPFNISTGFGTKWSNPTTLPPTPVGGIAFN